MCNGRQKNERLSIYTIFHYKKSINYLLSRYALNILNYLQTIRFSLARSIEKNSYYNL